MTNLNSKVSWTIFGIFLVLVLGVTGYYSFKFYKDNKVENIDKIVKEYVLANSNRATVKDVTITSKKTYTDKQGIEWLAFHVTPVPVTATDPATGVMEKISGKWKGINFGTGGVEQGLSVEVGEGLGFNMDFKKYDTSIWKTYTNSDLGITFKYPDYWNNLTMFKNENSSSGPNTDLTGSYYSSGYDGKATTLKFYDPDRVFTLSTYTKDYQAVDWYVPNTKSISPLWTTDEFASNMQLDKSSIYFVKKLSDKSILVAYYLSPECSPTLILDVLTPLSQSHPNFEIQINENFDGNKAVKDFISQREKAGQDACDMHDVYRGIADKIKAGTYSTKLDGYIKTAQTIADSLIVSK